MKQKSVGIVIPYFGKLPKNIITFLLSCRKNPSIHWFIFTNDSLYKKLNSFCDNVSFIKSSLQEVKKRLIKVTGINNIVLNNAYKICDYKPLYGKIFAPYLKGYDYWGYSDIDIVYGNLRKFINKGLDDNFQKIGIYGHFILIRNDKSSNNIYNLPIIKNGHKIYLFRDKVSQSTHVYAFDEYGGMNIICKQHNIKSYYNPDLVNDIIFPDLDVNTHDIRFYRAKKQCFIWDNGRAIFFYVKHHKLMKHEYGYFHFQKRRVFKNYIGNESTNLFSITTFGYNRLNYLNDNIIVYNMNKNKSSFINRLKYKLKVYCFTTYFATRMHIGKVKLPIKYVLKSIFVNHDFRIFKI